MGETTEFFTDELLRWIGFGVVALAIYFKEEVKTFIKRNGKKNGKSQTHFRKRESDDEMRKQIDDLHEWHDHDDPSQPGVKIWWVGRDLKDSIDKNTEAVTLLTAKIDLLK